MALHSVFVDIKLESVLNARHVFVHWGTLRCDRVEKSRLQIIIAALSLSLCHPGEAEALTL